MRVVLAIILLLQLVACSSNKTKNVDKAVVVQKDASKSGAPSFFSTSEQIAWTHYQEYLAAGMSHNEALVMLRRYNGSRGPNPQTNDLRLEASQKIDYYCIVNEGKGKYPLLADCKKWAQSVHMRCEVYEFGYYSSRVIQCLQREFIKGRP